MFQSSEPNDLSGGAPQTHLRRVVAWSFGLLLLPVLYVLSIGPATFVIVKYPAFNAPLTVLYRPAVALMNKHTVFEQPLQSYISFWISVARSV